MIELNCFSLSFFLLFMYELTIKNYKIMKVAAAAARPPALAGRCYSLL